MSDSIKGRPTLVWVKRGLWDRERYRLPTLHAPSKYVVFSVDQLDTQFVLTGRKTRQADCIVVTRFHPTPREVAQPGRTVVLKDRARRHRSWRVHLGARLEEKTHALHP